MLLFFHLYFLCSLELSGSKVGHTVIKISSNYGAQTQKLCGDNASIFKSGMSFGFSLFLLSSLCVVLHLCLKSQLSERETKWERKRFLARLA